MSWHLNAWKRFDFSFFLLANKENKYILDYLKMNRKEQSTIALLKIKIYFSVYLHILRVAKMKQNEKEKFSVYENYSALYSIN